MKILVTEAIVGDGLEILCGCAQVDIKMGLGAGEIGAIVGDYDALVMRSQTQVSAGVIATGKNLHVIARGGWH